MANTREKVGFLKINGKNHMLYRGLNVIGRNKLATVILRSLNVSHQHSIITVLDDDKYFISDINSSNGTYMKGMKLKPLVLYEMHNLSHLKFAGVEAVFFEVPKGKGEPSSEAILSQSTQNSETFYQQNTQLLDSNDKLGEPATPEKSCGDAPKYNTQNSVQQISIHDLPTQILTEKEEKDVNSSNFEHNRKIPNIHDLPTQILDIGLNVFVKSTQNSEGIPENYEHATGKDMAYKTDTDTDTEIQENIEDSITQTGVNKKHIDGSNSPVGVQKTTCKDGNENIKIDPIESSINNITEIIDDTFLNNSANDDPSSSKNIKDTHRDSSNSESQNQLPADKKQNNSGAKTPDADFKNISKNSLDSDPESQLHVKELRIKSRNRIESGSKPRNSLDFDFKITDNLESSANSPKHVSPTSQTHFDSDPQSPLHVNRLKVKASNVIRSDSETPSSLDSDSQSKPCTGQRRVLEKSRVDSDYSVSKMKTKKKVICRSVEKTNDKRRLSRRVLFDKYNSSSETDTEDALQNKPVLSKVKFNKLESREKFKTIQLNSDSDTDIEKNSQGSNYKKLPKEIKKVTNTKKESGSVVPENLSAVSQNNYTNRKENSEFSQDSFKLVLTNTNEFINSSGESDDYMFGNATQVCGSIKNSSIPHNAHHLSENLDELNNKLVDIILENEQFLKKSEKIELHEKKGDNDTENSNENNFFLQSVQQIQEDDNHKLHSSKTDNFKTKNKKKEVIENLQSLQKFGNNFDYQLFLSAENTNEKKEGNIFMKSMQKYNTLKNKCGTQSRSSSSSESSDFCFQPTQEGTFTNENAENENIFLEPTQKCGVINESTKESTKLSLHKEDDTFIQSTQVIEYKSKATNYKNADNLLQSTYQKSPSDDEDIFIQPTQAVECSNKAANYKKADNLLQSTSQKVTSNDEDIFIQPTQLVEASSNNKRNSFKKFTQAYDNDKRNTSDIFLEPTQKIHEADEGTKESIKTDEVTTQNIFMQETEEIELINEKEYNLGKSDNIFLQPTQRIDSNRENAMSDEDPSNSESKKLEHKTDETTMKLVTSGTKEKDDISECISVESQLEVMFATQTLRVSPSDTGRPSNPLANIFNSNVNNSEPSTSLNSKENNKINQERRPSLENRIEATDTVKTDVEETREEISLPERVTRKVTGSIKPSGAKSTQVDLNMHTMVVVHVPEEQQKRRRTSTSSNESVRICSSLQPPLKRRGASNVEVTLENQRVTSTRSREKALDDGTVTMRTKNTESSTNESADEEIETKVKKKETARKPVTRKQLNKTTEGKVHLKSKRVKLNSSPQDKLKLSVLQFCAETDNEDFPVPSTIRKSERKIRTSKSEIVKKVDNSPNIGCPSTSSMISSSQKRKRTGIIEDTLPEDVKPSTPLKTRKLSSLTLPSPVRTKIKPRVVFTMVDNPEFQTLVRRYGGTVVDTVEAATVLVASSLKRTQKLLSAIGLGKPICSIEWLEESKKANQFLDPWGYILKDKEAEKKWHLSLRESLERSKKKKLLEGHVFHLFVSNAADVLKSAIESCGGKCVTRAPSKNSGNKYVVVASPENKNKCKKFQEQKPPVTVVLPEAIFDGVLRQQLQLEKHLLT